MARWRCERSASSPTSSSASSAPPATMPNAHVFTLAALTLLAALPVHEDNVEAHQLPAGRCAEPSVHDITLAVSQTSVSAVHACHYVCRHTIVLLSSTNMCIDMRVMTRTRQVHRGERLYAHLLPQ